MARPLDQETLLKNSPLWKLVAIVVLLAVSAMPYFLGLVVTLPVLGHTTWHLYRRIIAPLPGQS